MSMRWIDRLAALALIALLGGCAAPAMVGPEDAVPAPVAEAKPEPLPPLVIEAHGVAKQALIDGDPELAVVALDEALARHPDQPLLLLNRGIARHALGEMAAAREDFSALLALHPGQPVAHNYLGMLARAEGDFAGAREHYEAALASAPQHALAHRNLAILCDLYLQQADCALEHYRAYLQAAGEDKQVQRWVKDLSRRAGG